jgi:hypothetical protein
MSGDGQTTGPFILKFSVPFLRGKMIDIDQTVKAVEVPITLEKVIISPWATRATFKFESANKYTPIVSLHLPDGDSRHALLTREKGTLSEQFIVGDLTDKHGQWELRIEEVMIMPDTGEQQPGTHPASDTRRISGPWIFRFQVP